MPLQQSREESCCVRVPGSANHGVPQGMRGWDFRFFFALLMLMLLVYGL